MSYLVYFYFYNTIEVPVYIHMYVLNSNSMSCSSSSLLECSPATQGLRVWFPAETCLPRGALVEDEDDFGQISS